LFTEQPRESPLRKGWEQSVGGCSGTYNVPPGKPTVFDRGMKGGQIENFQKQL